MNAQAQELLAEARAEQRPLLRFQLFSRLRGALDVGLDGTGPDAALLSDTEEAMLALAARSMGASRTLPAQAAPAGFWDRAKALLTGSPTTTNPPGRLLLEPVPADEAAAQSMVQQLPAKLLPRLLGHAEAKVRTQTAKWMLPEASVRAPLERLIRDERDPVALSAMALVLWRMGAPDSTEPLRAAVGQASTAEARLAVLTALARVSPSDRDRFARSTAVEERLAVAAALEGLPELSPLLDDPEPRVVLAALGGLPWLGDEKLIDRVARLTEAPNATEVRLAALGALEPVARRTPGLVLTLVLREATDPTSPLRGPSHGLLETICQQRGLSTGQLAALRVAEPGLAREQPLARSAVRRVLARDEPAVAPDDSSHAELFARVDADPTDEQAWAVLADALQAEGDVRGELIALANAGKPTRPLLDANVAGLLGPAADLLGARVGALLDDARWRRGLLEGATLRLDQDEPGAVPLGTLAAALLCAPLARFLTELRLGLTDEDASENDYHPVLEALHESRCGSRVRALVLGEFEYPDETEISWTPWGDVSSVWKTLPNLEHLQLRGAGGPLGAKPRAERLARLIVETGGLRRDTFDSVVALEAPSLEHLELWFGREDYGAECTADDLARLLSRTDLPRLQHLGVRNAEFLVDAIPELASSPLLRRLTSLDFSLGVLGDEGLGLLERHAKAFAHLTRFDFTGNHFSGDGQARLAALFPHAIVADQRSDDERYAAVGE